MLESVSVFIKPKIIRINEALQYFIRNANFYLTP